MANLSIRKLDTEVYEQLRIRSLKHGVSMEEETRRIIIQAVSAPEHLSEVFEACFGVNNGIEFSEILTQHQAHQPMDFT